MSPRRHAGDSPAGHPPGDRSAHPERERGRLRNHGFDLSPTRLARKEHRHPHVRRPAPWTDRCPVLPGPEGFPSESPPHRAATDPGPIPGTDEEGRRACRMGSSPSLPVERQADRPARAGSHRPDLAADPRTAERRDADQTGPGGRGHSHPGVRVRPRWRDDRDDPDGRPRGPAGRGGRRGAPTTSWTTAATPWALAFSPDGRSLAVGGTEPDIFLYDLASRRSGASPGDADPRRSRAWPSPPTAAPWPRRVTSITRSSFGTSPRGGSGRGCGATNPP